MSAFLCAKTALQLRRRRRQRQRQRQYAELTQFFEFPGTLLFISASLAVAIYTLILHRAFYKYWFSDKAYECIECSALVRILDSSSQAINWIIALYVLWRVARQQGGWRGTISRLLLYGGYLCAVIIVLCTIFNETRTPKELAPFHYHKSSGANQNHTASAVEPIASPTRTEPMSTTLVVGSNTAIAETNTFGIPEEDTGLAGTDTSIRNFPQPSPLETVPASSRNSTEPFRLANAIDIPGIISWVFQTGAEWSMAGLLPLLVYIQRQQIPSIGSFTAYAILVTILPVVDAIGGVLVFLYIVLGYGLYGDHSSTSGKDDETMKYFTERAETGSVLAMLPLQYLVMIGLYLVSWYGHKWEAPHLRQHLHDDHDAYQFDSYSQDEKHSILGLNETPSHIQQDNCSSYAPADLTRRSI